MIRPGWSYSPRTRGAQQALKAQFIRREPERVYLAVVAGHPSPPEGTWRDRFCGIACRSCSRQQTIAIPAASKRSAGIASSSRSADASLVEVRLHTGKRNQIRIQAALRGHPLVGERAVHRAAGTRRAGCRDTRVSAARRFTRGGLGSSIPADRRPLAFEAPLPRRHGRAHRASGTADATPCVHGVRLHGQPPLSGGAAAPGRAMAAPRWATILLRGQRGSPMDQPAPDKPRTIRSVRKRANPPVTPHAQLPSPNRS